MAPGSTASSTHTFTTNQPSPRRRGPLTMKTSDSHPLTRRQMIKTTVGLLAAGLSAPHSLVGQTPRRPPIRVGVLGAAHVHLEHYARLLRSDEEIQVKAVYDNTPAIARLAADATGGSAVGSMKELLADEAISAVIILSENNKHEAYAIAAAAAGKHLFVEKPLAIAGPSADRIAAAVEQAGVLFQTGYFMPGMVQLRFLRTAIREGHFGRLTRMRLQYAHGGSLGGMWDGHHAWMVDEAQVGRGALGDLGIHSLNALLWITEGDPIRHVSAHLGNATGGANGLDEYGEAALQFESGLLATIGAGYVDQNDVNRIEISGTEGHAYMNRGRLFLKCPNLTGNNQERYWSDFPEPLAHPFELFLAALKGANPPLISVTDAARDVRVMDEIYRVAKFG